MTIHEFTRYIPLGSTVKISLWNENRTSAYRPKASEGMVFDCLYSQDRGSQDCNHIVRIRTKNGETQQFPLSKIAYVDIVSMPDDFGIDDIGNDVTSLTTHLFTHFNDFMDPGKFKDTRFSLKNEFPAALESLAQVLARHELTAAADQIRSLSQNGHTAPMPDPHWHDTFSNLAVKRAEAEQSSDPDAVCLRRGEALLCCFAHRKHFYPDALRYAASLTVKNLVQENTQVLPPSAYLDRHNDPDKALDWFILAAVYFSCQIQNSCTYAALVQCILHRGSFFENHVNRRLFCYLCGSAHDYTLMSYLLSRLQQTEHGVSQHTPCPERHLTDLGRLMCWMLYQMGGAGAMDAAELIALVEAENHTTDQLHHLQEVMLIFCHKYAPRNRNDRFLAVSNTMRILLTQMQNRDSVLGIDSHRRYGYIYDFHGPRGAYLEEVNGHIMGTDLLPYWFSYSIDSFDIQVPTQLQNLYHGTTAEGGHILVPVLFSETPPGPKKFRFGAANLSIIPGGVIAL